MKRVAILYRDLQQMLGKHRGYIKPALFEDALEFASRGLFDHYYGNTEEYRPGKPLPRVAYQLTTAVSDALHPFLREARFTDNNDLVDAQPDTTFYLDQAGEFTPPDGWVHPTSFDVLSALEPVQVLDDNEVRTTLSSLICAPDEQHPMLEVRPSGRYRVHPATVHDVYAKYLGYPRRAKLVYAYPDDDSDPIYDDKASIDLEWPPSRDNQLLTRMLAYPALALRDNVVQQVARELSERGK